MEKYKTSQMHLFQVAEIQVSFMPSIPPFKMPQIISSQTLYDVMLSFWDKDTIHYQEHFCVAYLNRANQIIGIHTHSIGGIAGTVVDVRQILGIALKGNACGICLAHNHPSGNIHPSKSDISITKKIKESAKVMEVILLDHLVITHEDYYSFADEGLL